MFLGCGDKGRLREASWQKRRVRAVLDEQMVKKTIEGLNELQNKEPQELIARLREEELNLVAQRNAHRGPARAKVARPAGPVGKINTALSLVIVLEYPISDLERDKIKDAVELLKSL